jgi:hypothetical protein
MTEEGYGSLFGGKHPKSDKRTLHHHHDPEQDMFATSWLSNPLQDRTTCLIHLTQNCHFWIFPKLKKSLKEQRFADIPGIQCNVTKEVRYCGKRVSRLYPAVASSSQEVRTFTRRYFEDDTSR